MAASPRSDAEPLRLGPHTPVLKRDEHQLQIGLEPSLVVPSTYAGIVEALSTGSDLQELTRLARRDRLPVRTARDLVALLEGHRMLQPQPDPWAASCVRVVGAGPLGERLSMELAAAGVGTIYLTDLPGRPARRSRSARDPAPTPGRVEVVAAAVAERHPSVRVRPFQHFARPDDAVDLTVVVADGPEPDRSVSDHLRQHEQPHLVVRSSGPEVLVGPLVVPGVSSCLQCTDLARRDADPRWPWLLDQLTRIHLPLPPSLASWAAATAVTQVLGFLAGGEPETSGHTLELRSDDHVMRHRRWPAHPECGCGAYEAGRTEPDETLDPAEAVEMSLDSLV